MDMKKQLNLSTSNSKRYFLNILKLILFIAIFFITNSLLGSKLEKLNIKTSYYSEIKWNEFYSMDPNSMDLLFLGASHCYRAFDPEIFDNELDTISYNMGSPLQKPVESYYLLKETLKHHKPSVIVYDVHYGVFNQDKYLSSKLWNFDGIKPSLNKFFFLLDVFDQDQYFYAAIKSVRYHDNFKKMFKSSVNIDEKNKENVEKYLKNYKGKGFIIDNNIISLSAIEKSFDNSRNKIAREYPWNERQLKYFHKILKLCQEENIEVILVTAPMSPSYIEGVNAHWYIYDKINEKVNSIAKTYNLNYFDYNIINNKDLIVQNSDFSDTTHLNYEGAQKISYDFANRLKLNWK